MRRTRLGLAAPALIAMAGCVFTPVSLEGRRCATTADCVTGYECSPELVCVLTPDVGRPDAGRPDAFLIDVGRDAPVPAADAAGSDAALVLDAPGNDAATRDDSGAGDAGPRTDGAVEEDAGGTDAASLGDAGTTGDAGSTADVGAADGGPDAAT